LSYNNAKGGLLSTARPAADIFFFRENSRAA